MGADEPEEQVDVVLVVRHSDLPSTERAVTWDLTWLPVPVQAFVYTEAEWREVTSRNDRFGPMLASDSVWVHQA